MRTIWSDQAITMSYLYLSGHAEYFFLLTILRWLHLAAPFYCLLAPRLLVVVLVPQFDSVITSY